MNKKTITFPQGTKVKVTTPEATQAVSHMTADGSALLIHSYVWVDDWNHNTMSQIVAKKWDAEQQPFLAAFVVSSERALLRRNPTGYIVPADSIAADVTDAVREALEALTSRTLADALDRIEKARQRWTPYDFETVWTKHMADHLWYKFRLAAHEVMKFYAELDTENRMRMINLLDSDPSQWGRHERKDSIYASEE